MIILLFALTKNANVVNFPGLAAKFVPSGSDYVVQGFPVDLICESDHIQAIDECRFTVPGFYPEIKIFDGLKREKYEFIGLGLKNGKCGLRLLKTDKTNNGTVSCKLIFEDASEKVATTDMTVLHPIEKLEILSNSLERDYVYEENHRMEFNCSAEGGYPTPFLTLSIGICVN